MDQMVRQFSAYHDKLVGFFDVSSSYVIADDGIKEIGTNNYKGK